MNREVARRLSEIIRNNEEWLMNSILGYAIRQGYSRYTSTLAEAWRLSIQGLTKPMIASLEQGYCDLELTPDEDYLIYIPNAWQPGRISASSSS